MIKINLKSKTNKEGDFLAKKSVKIIVGIIVIGILFLPIRFYVEEILFEGFINKTGILSIISWPISIYIYQLLIVVTTIVLSAVFYVFIISMFEQRKWVRLSVVLIVIVVTSFIMLVQSLKLAFFDFQCVTPAEYVIPIISKTCSTKYSTTRRIPNSYISENKELFTDIIITREEFEKIKKHDGDIAYFCQEGCYRRNYSCQPKINEHCEKCVKKCDKQWGAEIKYAIDYLKSKNYQECINKCRE